MVRFDLRVIYLLKELLIRIYFEVSVLDRLLKLLHIPDLRFV